MFVKDVESESFDEVWHVLVASDSSKAVFGPQQSGDAPAMPHVAVTISLHSPGDFADSAEHRFDGVRCGEESFQVAFKAKADHGDCFVKTFRETRSRIRIDRS